MAIVSLEILKMDTITRDFPNKLYDLFHCCIYKIQTRKRKSNSYYSDGMVLDRDYLFFIILDTIKYR
jgi:hypothetical protein